MKKRFKCKQCYSRARIIIALNDEIRKQRTAIEVLSADLTRATDWIGAVQKQMDSNYSIACAKARENFTLRKRVEDLEGDSTWQISVLTEELMQAEDLMQRMRQHLDANTHELLLLKSGNKPCDCPAGHVCDLRPDVQ
jgi:uncharacterized coiled-coil protein SlyX